MLRRDSSNSNSWSKIWLRVDSKTYGIDLVVTFESNGEKNCETGFFASTSTTPIQVLLLLSSWYCRCLSLFLSPSLSITATMPQPFPVSICHCVWVGETVWGREREWERESIGLRLGEGIQFPSVMAWLWGTAAALIRLGGSKFSSHNIQKWFFSLLHVHLLTTVVRATINIITIINNFSLVCVCVCVCVPARLQYNGRK